MSSDSDSSLGPGDELVEGDYFYGEPKGSGDTRWVRQKGVGIVEVTRDEDGNWVVVGTLDDGPLVEFEHGGPEDHTSHSPDDVDELFETSYDEPPIIEGEEGTPDAVAVDVPAMRQFTAIITDHWVPLLKDGHTALGTVSFASGGFPHAHDLSAGAIELRDNNRAFLAKAIDALSLVGTSVHDMSVLYEKTENDNLVEIDDLMRSMARAQAQVTTLGAGTDTDSDTGDTADDGGGEDSDSDGDSDQ